MKKEGRKAPKNTREYSTMGFSAEFESAYTSFFLMCGPGAHTAAGLEDGFLFLPPGISIHKSCNHSVTGSQSP